MLPLSNRSIYSTWKYMETSYENNKVEMPAPTCDDKFELLDGSNSVSDIQNNFKYIMKKHETVTDYHPVRIYIKNRK